MSTLSKNSTLAKSIQNGLFGKRDSIEEAVAYAKDRIFACGIQKEDHIFVETGLQVLLNTLAEEIRKAKQ